MSETERILWGKEAPLVERNELKDWIICEDNDVLVVNKPGWLVCHPSKNGPASSLVGAVREYLGLERLHLISRLDRETSGLVLFAKHRAAARRYQMAIQAREVSKSYLAVLDGRLEEAREMDLPIGQDRASFVHVKQRTYPPKGGGQAAVTHFRPLTVGTAHTLVEVNPVTGRKHQIRVHAQAMGHSVVGDKLYGRDEGLYLRFIEEGWTVEHADRLELERQALHCAALCFHFPEGERQFEAPLFEDMIGLCDRLELSVPGSES